MAPTEPRVEEQLLANKETMVKEVYCQCYWSMWLFAIVLLACNDWRNIPFELYRVNLGGKKKDIICAVSDLVERVSLSFRRDALTTFSLSSSTCPGHEQEGHY